MNAPEKFNGFNLGLLTGRTHSNAKPVKLGVSGVSSMGSGFAPNFNRVGMNPLPPGPGVVREKRPANNGGPLRTQDFSLYAKGPGTAVANRLYGQASNPKNLNALTSKMRR